jgi:flagellar hook-associated protein 1 FlgK
MGASPLMSLGIKAMTANYAALTTTGHNIANANVAGYSRQTAEFQTSQGQFTGAGFFGKGVDVTTVSRAHNAFLTREAASASSLSEMDAARLQQLQRLEEIFQTGEQGLGYATNDFLNSMADLAARPGDQSVRTVVLGRAADLASRFDAAGLALDDVQAGVTAELRSAVSEINGLAQGIAAVNQKIAALRGLGQPANDVLDERDRLIARLSELVKVSRIEAEDGTTAIFVGGGQRLVLGAEAGKMAVTQDPSDPSRSAIGLVEGGVVRNIGSDAIGGGSVAGLLNFQNKDLVDGRNLIGRLAATVGGVVNIEQQRGLTLRGDGQPAPALFALGPAQAIPGASNQRGVNGLPLASVSLTITDPGALKASDYDLRADPNTPGGYLLTRLSDGLSTPVVDGSIVDGMQISLGSPAPAATDRFLLQPVGRAANGMKLLLDDPRDLAAAAPLVASTDARNLGTAAVASLGFGATALPVPGATARITFTSDSGDYSWELLDASNAVVGSGSGVWAANQPIPAPPSDINGFSLQITGVPRSGDILDVEPTPPGTLASNNGNAVNLLALRDAALIDGRTLGEGYSLAMAEIGVRVQGAASAAGISSAVAGQAERSRSGEVGVNLDEEAARLIQFQQSYQAAAKVLQIAQSLFDTLLDAAGA